MTATTSTRLAKHRAGTAAADGSGRHLCEGGRCHGLISPPVSAVGRIGRGPYRPGAVMSGDRLDFLQLDLKVYTH